MQYSSPGAYIPANSHDATPPSSLSSCPFPTLSIPPHFPLVPLRSRSSLIQLVGCGGAVSSPSRVRDRPPAEIDVGAF